MEKLKKVKIENFRNIKSLEFNINSDATIVAGKNGIGKSNVINALVWFFTDSIYTDNLGVGENDINSIVPKDQIKGEKVSVEVTFDNDTTLRKEYITGYDRLTGKANKHTTKGFVNGIESKNMDEFKNVLNGIIGFEHTFNNVKELNLYIDPLYALQKLDSKELRQFLINIGCSVTNEELFNLGFEDLRKYESTYLGNFTAMRTDLKKKLKAINDSLKSTEVLRNQYNDVEEVKPEELESINNQITKLNEEKAELKVGSFDTLIKEKNIEINTIISNFDTAKSNKLNALNNDIEKIKNDINIETQNLNAQKTQKCSTLKSSLEVEKNIKANLETQLKANESQKQTLKSKLEFVKVTGKSLVDSKKKYSSLLLETKSKEFTGYVTCPDCGKSFAPNEEELEKFNIQKETDIKYCNKQIADANLQIQNCTDNVNQIVYESQKIDAQIKEIQSQMYSNDEKIKSLQIEIADILEQPEDTSKLDNLNEELKEVQDKVTYVLGLQIYNDEEYITKNNELTQLKEQQVNSVQEVLKPIEDKLKELEVKKSELIIKQDKWNTKIKYSKEYDDLIAKFNDVEALSSRVDAFIHKMIACINSKAKELTGIEFVMLEENLGNDGIKEVCYATIDGVPFANVNTAQKYITGIRFIQRIKEIALRDFDKPKNTLPILADKFEGIDSVTTIKNLTGATGEQLICSRVTDDKEMRFM